MTKIKLCGLTCPADVAAANAARPDYVGFILAPGRRRTVTPAQAAALRQGLAPGILTVGVFVDEDPAQVAALLNGGVIDIAQLHGREDETYRQALRGQTGRPFWQAFQLAGWRAADLARLEGVTADALLLDSGAGSGRPFDWTLLQGFARPYILAGGLTPANVTEALRRCRPAAVDVSSGVETNGRKDPQKVQAFVQAVRQAAG